MNPSRSERWLAYWSRRQTAKCRLLCFAHAGGSAASFAQWDRALPGSVELCALKMPGRDDRRAEPHPLNIRGLVSELVEVLGPAQDRPVALFGYSLGALIAFEYARALRLAGLDQPLHLFVAACRAPQFPLDRSIADLPRDAFVQVIAQRYGGIPAAILAEPELLEYFLPVLRGDLRLLESYRYTEAKPLACPITAIGGDIDARVTASGLDAWNIHTTANFERHQFPGGHFFASDIAQRRALLEYVAARIRGHT